MRGNIAAGILKHMDLQKPVANSDKDYITIAIKLAQDGEYRRLICSRIRFRVMRCSMMLPGSGQWKNF